MAISVKEIKEGFAALTQTGGIIPEPKRPQEHYHNARLYEQRGDAAAGERLDPKPGRADDFTWPRPAPEPVVHVTARPADRTRPVRAFPAPRDPNLPPLPVQNPLR